MFFPASPTLAASSGHDLSWILEQMDMPGRVIVGILVICSLVGWAAMITKSLDVVAMRKRNLTYELRLRNVPAVLSLESVRSPNLAPYEYLTYEATQAYRRHRGRLRTVEDVALCMGHVENAVRRGIARNMQRYEEKMILLTTLVSGGPFLGLLGTVWGVMMTFASLSDGATIAKMAPGVSGALVATTVGLLVAIPATFGYNYLLSHTKVMTTELENFASSLADRIELELRESARRNREGRRTAPADDFEDSGDAPEYRPQPEARDFNAPRPQIGATPRIVRSADFGPDSPGYSGELPPTRAENRLRETDAWDDQR